MSEVPFDFRSVLDSIEKWHAGNLCELETYRLKELLRHDARARQIFVEYGDMLATLDLTVGAEASPDGSHVAVRALGTHRFDGHWRRYWMLASTITVTAICAVLVIWWATPMGPLPASPHDLAAQIRNSPPPETSISSSVTVTDVFWNENSDRHPMFSRAGQDLPYTVGMTIPFQASFVLEDADLFVRVRYANGADLLFQGPATVYFDSENSASILAGRVSCVIPPAAVGFTILSPHGRIRDLGTEFAVSVSEEETDVSVVKGSVECELTGPGIVSELTTLFAGDRRLINDQQIRHPNVSLPPDSLSSILGHRSGIRKTQGAIHYAPGFAPLPREKINRGEERMYVYLERQSTPLAWDQQQGTFSTLLSTEMESAVLLPEPLRPEHHSRSARLSKDSDRIVVDTYLLNFFPTGKGKTVLAGSMTFHNDIIAVMTSPKTLDATDRFSPNPEFIKAWEQRTSSARGSNEAEDFVSVSDDAKTLTVSLQASGAGDQLRIFVYSPEK